MKIKALSHYNSDKNTRYGDCILAFNNDKLLVYDCGHERHAEEVLNFLKNNSRITEINIVISHNDSDHTDGIIPLMRALKDEDYTVKVYTSLYLKSIKEIQDELDDARRKKNKTCEHILQIFDNIADIVTVAEELDFIVKDAVPQTDMGTGIIVGPTKKEFIGVVVRAIENDGEGQINGETVMNAASVQVKCILDNNIVVLLCGDASPDYIHNIDIYDIIQFPHHGQLNDGKKILDELDESYNKQFIISDNTGSSDSSGGSDELVKYMKDNKYTLPHNTKDGVIELPKEENKKYKEVQGVNLGDLDCK